MNYPFPSNQRSGYVYLFFLPIDFASIFIVFSFSKMAGIRRHMKYPWLESTLSTFWPLKYTPTPLSVFFYLIWLACPACLTRLARTSNSLALHASHGWLACLAGSHSIQTRAISPTSDKSPFNVLFYKPPTSARNILVIVELGFSQFCLLCALVRLWVELTCIRRTKIFQPMMARTPETYPSSTSHDNFYDSGITTRGKTSQWRSVGWLRWLKQFFECRIFHLWRNNSGLRESIRNWR